MTAFHVRQSLRDPRAHSFWALAALLAAASACGKITSVQPVDAAPVPPDAGAIGDAAVAPDATPVPPDAGLGTLVTLKHASSLTVQLADCLSCMNNTVPQTHADNSWFLVLDLAAAGIVGDFQVARVQVGVQESIGATGTQPAEINLYTLPAGAELVRANLQFVATRAHDVPNLELEVMDMPISASIPAGSTLVAEIYVPDGEFSRDLFKMGCNRLGSTGPSYIEAPSCAQITKITSFESLGTTDKHLVMAVQGYDLGASQDLRGNP